VLTFRQLLLFVLLILQDEFDLPIKLTLGNLGKVIFQLFYYLFFTWFTYW